MAYCSANSHHWAFWGQVVRSLSGQGFAETQATNFRALAESRRAVRRFTSEPVPDGVIWDCLQTAVLAPSSCNLQPWSFEVVRNPQLLQKLHPVCLRQSASKAPLLIAILARPDTWKQACSDILEHWPEPLIPERIQHFYQTIAPFQYNQGLWGVRGFFKRILLRVSGLSNPIMRSPNSHEEMRLWAVKSSALAAQNLMLAFQSHGFSTCPMEGFDEVRLREVLPIPQQAIPIMVLAVGMAGEQAVNSPRLRFPLDAHVRWH
ncbi:nitroreductase family protein [Pseudomonas sp. YH-1]|uniref:nitroreductase family protein n=1 Tax=Pseudomonas sp. YH-1 TaxID=3384787 RepID=UPI003F7F4A92